MEDYCTCVTTRYWDLVTSETEVVAAKKHLLFYHFK